jgi:hypothetical protein
MSHTNLPKVFQQFWTRWGLSTPERFDRSALFFPEVLELEKTPPIESIKDHEFVLVRYKGKCYWVMFNCPCGCGEVISLPLQEPHKPRWSVYVDENGTPSLVPSIWRNTGCMSHFILRSGKIVWAARSGISPMDASPKHYQPRKPRSS